MPEVVRARLNGRESNMSRFFAERNGAEILDEPTHNGDGSPRRMTTVSGRPAKPKTSVAQKATEKSASPADGQAVTPSASNEKE